MPYPIYFEELGKEPEKDEEGNIIISEPNALNNTNPLYLKHLANVKRKNIKNFIGIPLGILKNHYFGFILIWTTL